MSRPPLFDRLDTKSGCDVRDYDIICLCDEVQGDDFLSDRGHGACYRSGHAALGRAMRSHLRDRKARCQRVWPLPDG